MGDRCGVRGISIGVALGAASVLFAGGLEAQQVTDPGVSGERLYISRGCLGCHGASGRGGVGPPSRRRPFR